MPVFIVRMKFPSAPKKSVEIMIKGDSLDEALTGGMVEVFQQQRVVEPRTFEYKGELRHYKSIFYRRDKVREIVLGKQVTLPF